MMIKRAGKSGTKVNNRQGSMDSGARARTGSMARKREAYQVNANDLLGVARKHRFIGCIAGENTCVNLAGSYDYLSLAYYVSQDRLLAGNTVMPTCQDMLDAYVPPLFLEKARLANLPVPEFYISNGYFEPPVIVDPVNPFTLKGRVVLKSGRAKSIAKSLTRNFTYAICCQELSPGSRVAYFNSILGWSAQTKFHSQSRAVWDVFRIPMARVRVIQLRDGEILLSDISPLPLANLHQRELKYIEEHIQWRD